jgi:UDP-N-acetylmuramate--alanine ligase
LNLIESKVHFIGIGGIGMSGIAEVLVNMGCRVTGSDLGSNTQVERLDAMGVIIFKGHKASNIPNDCDVVVYSSAVLSENLEMLEARRRAIPVIQRAEMLSELMRLKRGIAIGGTHGKTTTTSMVASIMLAAALDPTIVVGGRLDLIKSTAALGKGQWLLAEADESDGSFLRLSPEIVVATNIDNDHLDHYKTFESLKNAFHDFLKRVPFYGLAIICADDENLISFVKDFPKRLMTYGFSGQARLRATRAKTEGFEQVFGVSLDNKNLGEITLKVPGLHNSLNALAAIAVAIELKIDFTTIEKGLLNFRGVDRRLQIWGEHHKATFIDDYGHHPTEVKATLQAIKSAYPSRRLLVVFQPHRFSRTQTCWNQFLTCFNEADVLLLLDIYPAGEKPIAGVTSVKLASKISEAVAKSKGPLVFTTTKELAGLKIDEILKPYDVVLTLGAGDVWKIASNYFKKIIA